MTAKAQLDEKIINFIKTRFAGEKDHIVLGEGKETHPAIMLVGEAPGAQEVIEKRPFVGRAGKNLNAFLQTVALEREELYVSNVVKFRPRKPGKTGKDINRTPSLTEVEAFLPCLFEEVAMVSPKVIVSLGNTPLYAFTGEKNIGQVHGKMMTVKIEERDYNLFPLYHPAAVIYNRSLTKVYEEDVRKLGELLQG